jgi:hypothetical protein
MSSSITLDHPKRQGRKSPGPKLIAAAGAMVTLAAIVAAIVVATGDGESKLTGSGADNFSLTYPDGWQELSARELGGAPGSPIAGVRSDDGSGFVFVRREGRAPRDFDAFSAQFTRELDSRLPDFQKRSVRIVKTAGGNAFFYSYIRKRRGTVHTVVVVPDGERSYALNTVSKGGEEKTARDVANIILSFKPN